MVKLIIGFIIGVFYGIAIMCILAVSKDTTEIKNEEQKKEK